MGPASRVGAVGRVVKAADGDGRSIVVFE